MPPVPRPTRPEGSGLNWLGAVLAGGASTRFGTDKASAMLDGRSFLDRLLSSLLDAGARRLAYVGGPGRSDVPHEAVHVPDSEAYEPCPLRGLLTTLEHADDLIARQVRIEAVMVVACDVPLLSTGSIRRVVHSLDGHDASVAAGERDHWACVAMRPGVLRPLRAAYGAGERSLHRPLGGLRLARVPVAERELTNVNEPDTLARVITDEARFHR